MSNILPDLQPLPIKERISVVFVEKAQIDVIDGAFVFVDKTCIRDQLGQTALFMVQANTRGLLVLDRTRGRPCLKRSPEPSS